MTLRELAELAATLDPSDFIEISGDGLVAHWLTEVAQHGESRLREIARLDLR